MIDYIRARYEPPYNLPTEIIDFSTQVNVATGETDGKMIGRYRNMKIIQYPSKQVYIEGSLHKFFNNADFNGNDFNRDDLAVSLYEIERVLGLIPQRLKLTNLEFGVNIVLPFNPQKVLNNLLFYRDKEFTKSITAGNFREVEQTQYFIKVYDKWLQYNESPLINAKKGQNNNDIEVIISNTIKPNTLRFEVKYKRMQRLNDMGVVYLSDLIKDNTTEILKRKLLECFNGLYFYDFTIDTKKMTEREKAVIKDYCNPNFWSNIEHKQKRHKKRKDYDKIVVKHSQNIKAKISDLITKKWDELSTKKGDQITQIGNPKKVTKLQLVYRRNKSPYSSPQEQGKKEGVKSSATATEKTRLCEVTKLDISMQKKGSKFLCFTGLKYYWKNERSVFEELERKYLPVKKRGVNLEDKMYYIAHNIRNSRFNAKHNRLRFENRNYPPHQMFFDF
ncbi:hypothetical protein [Riemerella columbipharyngis]|uniref:Uncharacterized protein n=1 Tax=Riemerella columbipharyngis TaxID=1071918 RepID=A0A1G7D9L2_9FLAO|nr:hypothetical protein [Riemerella columbipharyngis]SDE48247.1 hypothetical protein SAMN05421544_11059 [Riemerella columbipharyngis]